MDNRDDPWNYHRCKLCGYKTRFLHLILSHVRLHKRRSKNHRFICDLHSPESYQCGKCQFQAHLKVLQTKHFNTIHKSVESQHYPNPALKYCKNCDFQTYSSLALLGHNCTDTNGNQQIVQTSQTKNYCHYEEEKDKKKNKRFQCILCPYEATQDRFLKAHIFQKHNPSEQIQEICWFNCEHCVYKTNVKYKLQRHVLARHPESDAPRKHNVPKKICWFNCEHCAFKTKVKYNLQTHVLARHPESDAPRKHNVPKKICWFNCGHCAFKTKIKSNLRRHVLVKHTESAELEKLKRFKCDHCSYKTVRHDNLISHRSRKHNDPKEICWFNCEHCAFKTKAKYNLQTHVLARHPESARESALWKHNVPKEICWFSCEHCLYKTKKQYNLQRHILARHPKSAPQKYHVLKEIC